MRGAKQESQDEPAASTASRTASLLCVEQLSTIIMLFGPGNGFMEGSCINDKRVKEVHQNERLTAYLPHH